MLIENINWRQWPANPNFAPDLHDDEIACFKIDLRTFSNSNYEELKKLLRNEELKKMDAYKNPSDKKLYLATHGSLNLIIKAITGEFPSLKITSYGKPYMENSKLEFNVSHSGEMALIALSKKCAIGVDIEHALPIHNKGELLEQFFHTQEIVEINGLCPLKSDLGFYSCWTRKEAILKSLGNGLSINTNSFYAGSFLTSNAAQPKSPPGYPVDWNIWDFMIEGNYIACIAAPNNSHQPAFYNTSINFLCS